MNVVFHDGPLVLETDGQGPLTRDEARDIHDDVALALVMQGVVEPADAEAAEKVRTLYASRLAKAAESGSKISCLACKADVDAKTLLDAGCHECAKSASAAAAAATPEPPPEA